MSKNFKSWHKKEKTLYELETKTRFKLKKSIVYDVPKNVSTRKPY